MRFLAQRGRAGFSARLGATVCVFFCVAGCTRVFEDHSKQALETADQKYSARDYQGAVQYYEDAIDGTPATAEVHYKLALMFDDKLQNPIAAMYHYQRYLDLKPGGSNAKDAAAFLQRDRMKLSVTSSNGAFVTQEDAKRLMIDNQNLRKQLEELRAEKTAASRDETAKPGKTPSASAPGGGTSYVVLTGDTLASIARKFYKNPARYKDIENANYSKLKGSTKLKAGMILIIPK